MEMQAVGISRENRDKDRKMMNDAIYSIPILERFLVYNPLNRYSALVNKKAFHDIQDQLEKSRNNEIKYEGDFSEFMKELTEPVSVPAEKPGSFRPGFLGIIPSRRCNMSCVYCDFGSGNTRVIDPRIAVSAVDYMAEQAEQTRQKTYSIQFFGGEPFVEDEVIDIVVHHAQLVAGKTNIFPRIEACTNGFFTEKRARFIGDYFDRIILSIDGMEEMHNRTRGNFAEIMKNARLLSAMDIELSIRCCVTSDTAGKMEEISEWLCSDLGPEMINFETLSENAGTEGVGLFPPDPYDFARHFIYSSRIIEKYGIAPVYASLSTGKNRNSFCPLRKDSLIVFPDGKIAGCYLLPQQWETKGLDLNIGAVSPENGVTIDMEAVKRIRQVSGENPKCKKCFCRYSCGGGCVVNNRYSDDAETYNRYCIQTRLITACKLLEEMDLSDMCGRLLDNSKALDEIAKQVSDDVRDIKV